MPLQWGRAIVRAQARRRRRRSRRTRSRFNGGARLYARKPLRRARDDPGRTRFNGGARLYARKLDQRSLERYEDDASMGARDCTRASAARGRSAGFVSSLQWGRAIVRAQAQRDRGADLMIETLQWGRAIVRAQARRAALCTGATSASFNGGARLYARKPCEVVARRDRSAASMGARDCTRASVTRQESLDGKPVQLQWGRAIVRAQATPRSGRRRRASSCFNGGARLYARKLGCVRPRRTSGRRASMGARDCTRASESSASSIGRCRGSFNGGARLYARKPGASLKRGRHSLRFNGGARLYARKLTHLRHPPRPPAGFNGGARLYARKPACSADVGDRRALASMGARDCTRASAIPRSSAPPLTGSLQWGRAIVRAQARRAAFGKAALRRASMGARDCTRASATCCLLRPRAANSLQWGRAIVRAQASRSSGSRLGQLRLQWGRAIVRAQALPRVEHRERWNTASMGARDCTRASSEITLQWDSYS